MTDKMVENHEQTLVEHEGAIGRLRKGQAAIADDVVNVKRNISGLAEALAALQRQDDSDREPPLSWYTYTSKEKVVPVLAEVEDVVSGILVHIPGGILADCWRRHPYVVDLLIVITEGYNFAWGKSGGLGARMDFYTRYLPDFLAKIRDDTAHCNLRAARHNGDRKPAAQDGLDSFAEFELAWRLERNNPPIPEPNDEAKTESRNRMAEADVSELNK